MRDSPESSHVDPSRPVQSVPIADAGGCGLRVKEQVRVTIIEVNENMFSPTL